MDISRFQVPFDLPEPHFEDESTVVTARRVVPLTEARLNDRWRKILVIAPLLLAATVCGALGAVTVNYLEGRATVFPPAVTLPNTTTQKELPPPMTPVVASSASSEKAVATQPDSAVKKETDSQGEVGAQAAVVKKTEAKPEQPVTTAPKAPTQPDPRQLVRQRRVHAVSNETPSNQDNLGKSRGAGRIQDLFGGPNP
jgi:hypothetical protein